jgi:ACS family tartrate transporter-like MFS transporter
VLLSVVVLAFLTDKIDDARWLTAEQRAWLAARLERDHDASSAEHGLPPLRVLVHPLVWLLGVTFFLLNTSAYAYGFWAPTVIRDALHTSDTWTVLIVGAIACVTTLSMLAVGASSDRTGERCLHTAACGIVGAVGYVGAALLPSPVARVAALALVSSGFIAYYAPLFCLPTMLLRGSAAAAGIALVNSISNVGGFAGPSFVGLLKDATGGVRGSFLTLAGLGVMAAALCLVLRRRPEFAARGRPTPIR